MSLPFRLCAVLLASFVCMSMTCHPSVSHDSFFFYRRLTWLAHVKALTFNLPFPRLGGASVVSFLVNRTFQTGEWVA